MITDAFCWIAEVWLVVVTISLGSTPRSWEAGSICGAWIQVAKLPCRARAAILITFAETDAAQGGGGVARVGCGSLGPVGWCPWHVPVGTWRHCSSPQQWQRGRDVLHWSWQIVSQWLWGFGERVEGRGKVKSRRKSLDKILTRRQKGRRRVREVTRGYGKLKKKKSKIWLVSKWIQMYTCSAPRSPRHYICGSESLLPWVLPALSVSSQYGSQQKGFQMTLDSIPI